METPKRAGKVGSAPKRAIVTNIDPSVYAGTWRDAHEAVLAAGCTFREIGRSGPDRLSSWCLKYNLNPKVFPYVDPREDCLELGLPLSGSSWILDFDDIAEDTRIGSVRLVLRKAYICDAAIMVERAVAIAGFLGFRPKQIWEGGVGNHELTDGLARAFGLTGVAGPQAGAVHYYSEPNEFARRPTKACLVGTVGIPVAYQAKMDINVGGAVSVISL
ncbi:hypothetical protein [Collinsella intestinalis]|uniref:hypothetical protein n=1 Tax=Collinsella intestinalis TaxID=147207 RepID=UPI0019573F7D|nr:hypothetical protein [Collinsella intestinalis]MBM6942552.1 hypothetical protein [Collinsella intestinalis]